MARRLILVVDDNRDFCQNVKDILEMEGHRVATAYDGYAAVSACRDLEPDLVLMDVRMPALDGVLTFRQIKSLAPDMPVVMMTAYSLEEKVRQALRDGAFGLLRKPLDMYRLIRMVRDTATTGNILLVDDQPQGREYVRALRQRGYSVTVARTAEAALERVWECRFDLIAVNNELPAGGGLETFLGVRDIRPDAFVVMLGARPGRAGEYAWPESSDRSCDWLEKPVDISRLTSLLEKARSRVVCPARRHLKYR